MKNYFLLCTLALFVLSACSRRTAPPASGNTNARIVYPDKNKNKPSDGKLVTPEIPDTVVTVPAATNEKILVILDKGGRLAVSSNSVPPYVLAGNRVLPVSTPLTATQRSNLLARHHVLVPLALYVPEAKATQSAKGAYYRYKNKFWYWKKSDGFFYLDEIYYK